MPLNTDVGIHKNSWWKSIFIYGKWYLLSSLLTKGIGIILLPIYTRYLSTEEYGTLNTLNSIAQLLPILISLYLDSALSRFFHDHKENKKELAELFSSLYWFVFFFGSFTTLLFISSSYLWLENLFAISSWPYAYLAFFPALLMQLGLIGDVFLKQSLKARKTTNLLILATFVNVIVTLPLLINFDLGISARLWGGLISSFVLFIYYSIHFYSSGILIFKINIKILKKCLFYSIPLIPNIAGGWIAGMSDRLFIAKYDSLSSVGIYSLGFQLAFLLYIIQDAITQVQGPISMSGLIRDKENTKKKIANMSLLILCIMLTFHFFLVAFSKEILFVFADTTYKNAYVVIGIISFIYVLSSQYRLFSQVISFHKKTWIISVAGILMGIINLILNWIFIPHFGYISAAYATVFSTFFYTLWIIWWTQKLDKLPVAWLKIIQVLIIYGSTLWLGRGLFEKSVSLLNVLFKLSLSFLLIITFLFIVRNLIPQFNSRKI